MNITQKQFPYTLTAAVGLILFKDDKVLLLKRHGTGWANGYHSVVAGCVEDNESLTQALIRESYEEAGITIKPEWLSLGCIMHTKIIGRGTEKVIDIFFVCRKWENDILNKEPHKHEDLKFYPLNSLPKTLIPYVRDAIEYSLNGISYGESGWDTSIEIR